MELNPDTKEYLSQAAIALAQAEGIDPGDRPSFEEWVSLNMSQIAIKAMDLQMATLQKFFAHRTEIQNGMCEQVYSRLRQPERHN